jgi:hypothetical protein
LIAQALTIGYDRNGINPNCPAQKRENTLSIFRVDLDAKRSQVVMLEASKGEAEASG